MIKNKKQFEKIVRKNQKELKSYLDRELRRRGYRPVDQKGFLYAEGSVPVLLVAHMDTVHKVTAQNICWDNNFNVVMSPEGIGGDDRCGIYMILSIIKDLNCHVLFCEDEEVGGVGASHFVDSGIAPDVNYIIELDRRGHNDAVFYDCENPEFTEFICSYGFSEEYGSFSDISFVAPALGIAAVNISSGYYNAHSTHEYVKCDEMERNIEIITSMISEAHDTRYEYIEAQKHFRYNDWCRYYYPSTYKPNDSKKVKQKDKDTEVAYKYGKYSYNQYGEPLYSEEHEELPEGCEERLLMPLTGKGNLKMLLDSGEEFFIEESEGEFFAIDQHNILYTIDDYGYYEAEAAAYVDEAMHEDGRPLKFNKKEANYYLTIGY